MMMLLQWPWSMSPSRNQTPGAMMRTVSGLASDRETNSATKPSVVNSRSSSERRCFMDFPSRTTLHPFLCKCSGR